MLDYRRWPYFTLDNALYLGVIFIAFFLNIWGVPLFDLDEGAFSEATREMLVSGNFAATYLDGLPRFDKPILSYWFQALSVSIFGINEFAFRLPSAIAATVWVIVIYRFTNQQWGKESARFALLITATTLWVCVIGRAAIADAWLNLFICLAFFDIWRYSQHKRFSCLLRVYIWLALGLLTKGPVAAGIPFIATAIFFISQGQWRFWLSAVTNPIGWLVLMIVVSPWLVLVYQDQGIEFFKGFLLDHNVQRFSQEREGHGGSWLYYVLVLPLILLPYSGLLIKGISQVKAWWQQPINRFLLIWFAVVFVLVSLSQTKLPHYVMYGVTPLLILFANYRTQLTQGKWVLLFPAGFFALMLALPSLVALAAEQSKRAYEQQLFAQGAELFDWQYYVITGIFAALALAMYFITKWKTAEKLVAIGVVQTAFVFLVLIENIAYLQQTPVKQAAEIAKQYPQDSVVSYQIKMPSFSVYRQAITARRTPQSGDLVFTRVDRLSKLQQLYSENALTIVYQQGGIILVEIKDA
ncbi:glycosyltransferase family 39 protein [Saccharobesus litoralis]|uniref:Glycosyltransferase family 39 protein n=1 Tax=Saccharobesus litoralis TaxID=2172099 RepID=A0A2S0VRP5_9ALTE|nr:glycosyltransferase family 39 protein [Saccharobesus litoralis]AWB66842.1 glycosyltransferase family 39 protein [Saccharobesus litoralis]